MIYNFAMANKLSEYTDEHGRAVIEYDNGMIRSAENGRIIKPAPGNIITAENSSALHRARREKKRAAVRAVASANVKADKWRLEYGDAAYIAAITEQVTIKALNPSDPKQVDAARFLIKEAGDSEDQQTEDGGNDGGLRGVIADIAEIAKAINSTTRTVKGIDNQ